MLTRHPGSLTTTTSAPLAIDVLDLGLHHRLGHLGVHDAEDASEAAAGLGLVQRDQIQPPDRLQQGLLFGADAQAPREMAGGVAGDPVGKGGPDIGELQVMDEELAELPDACSRPDCQCPLRRSLGKHLRVPVLDELDTGA